VICSHGVDGCGCGHVLFHFPSVGHSVREARGGFQAQARGPCILGTQEARVPEAAGDFFPGLSTLFVSISLRIFSEEVDGRVSTLLCCVYHRCPISRMILDGTLFIETGTSTIIIAIRMDVMNFRASMQLI
jgi:hypothetical protein